MPIPALLPDLRRPGQPMTGIPVKIPSDYADTLQEHADRIGASRGALARHLVVSALQELEATATA
jgi:hypothetical protein